MNGLNYDLPFAELVAFCLTLVVFLVAGTAWWLL